MGGGSSDRRNENSESEADKPIKDCNDKVEERKSIFPPMEAKYVEREREIKNVRKSNNDELKSTTKKRKAKH
ncbi:hypothetical protein CsSME_00043716 [Camellia sinensis var. sinensis]